MRQRPLPSPPLFQGEAGSGCLGEIGSRVRGAKRPPPSLPLEKGEGPAGDGARLVPSSFSSPCFRGRPGGSAAPGPALLPAYLAAEAVGAAVPAAPERLAGASFCP